MKLKLHTEGNFDSAHYLDGYVGDCKNLHGHRWNVIVDVEGVELDDCGMLWDFKNLKAILKEFDHKCLNDLGGFKNINPTAENITILVHSMLKEKNPKLSFKVRVEESPGSWCEVKK